MMIIIMTIVLGNLNLLKNINKKGIVLCWAFAHLFFVTLVLAVAWNIIWRRDDFAVTND